jgi:hypothetical protein
VSERARPDAALTASLELNIRLLAELAGALEEIERRGKLPPAGTARTDALAGVASGIGTAFDATVVVRNRRGRPRGSFAIDNEAFDVAFTKLMRTLGRKPYNVDLQVELNRGEHAVRTASNRYKRRQPS